MLAQSDPIKRRPLYQKKDVTTLKKSQEEVIMMDLKKVIKIRACNEPEARKRT
jgi:hypothetical protein